MLGAEGSFGIKGTADRLLPRPAAAGPLTVYWVGFPLSFALALAIVPAGTRGLTDAGLERANYRGVQLAFPLGAVLATAALVALAPLAFLNDRADLELLDPELRSWMPYLLGIAFLGFLDDSLGGEQPSSAPRGWRGHAQALREGTPLDRCDQGDRGPGLGCLRGFWTRAAVVALSRRRGAA